MIVVTGATGNVGRPLVQALAAAGEEVTAVSRRPADSGQRPAARVHHRQADPAEPDSLRPLLDGADALYLLIAGGGAQLDPQALLDAAKTAGVRRVVLQSSQLTGSRPDAVSHAALRAFESAVRGSGLDWTVLRPGGFFSNAFRWAEQVREQRVLAAPFGDTALPLIDPADIAEAAATTLVEEGHTGRTYELTGPVPVTPRELAAAIGAAVGAPVRFVEQSRAEARAQLLQFMPEPVVEGTLDVLGAPSAAEQQVSPAVEQLIGRPPRSFAEWALRHAEAFR